MMILLIKGKNLSKHVWLYVNSSVLCALCISTDKSVW